jgi:hypothetical protein
MSALAIRGSDTGEVEVFLDGGWIYFSDVTRIADLLRRGVNPWLSAELRSLRESSATELATVLEFWLCPIDADTSRH